MHVPTNKCVAIAFQCANQLFAVTVWRLRLPQQGTFFMFGSATDIDALLDCVKATVDREACDPRTIFSL
jgi:hypothetical protein